jgi:hypothetical protein
MTTADPQPSLIDQTRRFGDDVTKVVRGAFGIDPNVVVIESRARYVIRRQPVSLKAAGEELATLAMSIRFDGAAGWQDAIERAASVSGGSRRGRSSGTCQRMRLPY